MDDGPHRNEFPFGSDPKGARTEAEAAGRPHPPSGSVSNVHRKPVPGSGMRADSRAGREVAADPIANFSAGTIGFPGAAE
jgi:hypothetical protein